MTSCNIRKYAKCEILSHRTYELIINERNDDNILILYTREKILSNKHDPLFKFTSIEIQINCNISISEGMLFQQAENTYYILNIGNMPVVKIEISQCFTTITQCNSRYKYNWLDCQTNLNIYKCTLVNIHRDKFTINNNVNTSMYTKNMRELIRLSLVNDLKKILIFFIEETNYIDILKIYVNCKECKFHFYLKLTY